MKKYTSLLALLLVLGLCAAPLAALGTSETPPLVVGSATALTGRFYSTLFGNNTVDIDVRRLVHGYELLAYDNTGAISKNPTAVRQLDTSADPDGNTVYTFTLNPDLKYSDGMDITARDYALNLLLQFHPLMAELGGQAQDASWLLGASQYQEGQADAILGLRLKDRHVLSITVTKQAQSRYALSQKLSLHPVPAKAVIPGMGIADEGQGASIKGEVTLPLLASTLLDPVRGYVSHPAPASGPYALESFDGTSAHFVKNKRFLGNDQGLKPTIDRLVLTQVSPKTAQDDLASGRVHLFNKASDQNLITAAQAAGLQSVSYDRTGLAYLAFSPDSPLSSLLPLRQGIAHAVDRLAPGQALAGERAQAVDGFYGLGLWMARQYVTSGKGEIKTYALDLAQAEQDFEKAGFTLQEDGQAFQAGKGIRHRQEGDTRLALNIRLLIPENNQAADALAAQMEQALNQAGASLVVSKLPFAQVLAQYYGQSERDYDLVFMATNFSSLFSADSLKQAGLLSLGEADLLLAAQELDHTAPGDTQGYYDKWLAFQSLLAEQLPLIPLYTNAYADLYSPALTGYDITRGPSFADALLAAQFAP